MARSPSFRGGLLTSSKPLREWSHALGPCCGPELSIEGGNGHHASKSRFPRQGGCQLHCVVAAEPMLPRQTVSLRNDALVDPYPETEGQSRRKAS